MRVKSQRPNSGSAPPRKSECMDSAAIGSSKRDNRIIDTKGRKIPLRVPTSMSRTLSSKPREQSKSDENHADNPWPLGPESREETREIPQKDLNSAFRVDGADSLLIKISNYLYSRSLIYLQVHPESQVREHAEGLE